MLETVGDDPQCESLHPVNSLLPGIRIHEGPGQIWNFGDPTAIVFPFEFDFHCILQHHE